MKEILQKLISSVLAKKSAEVFIIKIIGASLAFFLHIVIARLIGVEQYGIYTYTMNMINILIVLSGFGLYSSSIRFISVYSSNKEWNLLNGVLRYNINFVFRLSIIVACVSALIFNLELYSNMNSGLKHSLLIGTILIPLYALVKLHSAFLISFKESKKSSLLLLVFRPLGLLIAITISHFYNLSTLNSLDIIIYEMIVFMMVLSISIYWSYKALPMNVLNTKPSYKKKQWKAVAFPLLLVAGSNVILNRTDVFMIGSILTLKDVGIYGACLRISTLVLFGLTAAIAVVSPYIAEFYHKGEMEKLRKIIKNSTKGVFIATLLFVLLLSVFGNMIFSFFGSKFINAYMPFLILMIGHLFSASFGMVSIIMTVTGHEKQAGRIVLSSVFINIFLNYIFIKYFGINGAAIATVITTIIWNYIMYLYIKTKLNISTFAF